jgi:hypothetical protein
MGIIYQEEIATFRIKEGNSMLVFRNSDEIRRGITGKREDKCIWVGILTSSETFQYTDKKTKKKVTALKMYLSNASDTVEAVMWPNTYEKLKDPDPTKIVMAMGNMSESREPGKYSLSIDEIIYV